MLGCGVDDVVNNDRSNYVVRFQGDTAADVSIERVEKLVW